MYKGSKKVKAVCRSKGNDDLAERLACSDESVKLNVNLALGITRIQHTLESLSILGKYAERPGKR